MLELKTEADALINFRNHWIKVIDNLKYQKIIIFDRLPSLNEYVDVCRKNPFEAARFKRMLENEIITFIRIADAEPINEPCIIHIDWFEKGRKRDVDNIESAVKFILDALQGAGVLKNDSRKYVRQVSHNVIASDENGVIVWLITGDNVKDF